MTELDDILEATDRAQAFIDLVELYVARNDRLGEKIRNGWDFGVQWEFPDQRRIACVKGERFSPIVKAKASLVYYSVASRKTSDTRDVVLALAVIYNSMLIADVDANRIFEEVATVSEDSFRTVLRSFIARKEQDKSLRAFGLGRQSNQDGDVELTLPWDRVG